MSLISTHFSDDSKRAAYVKRQQDFFFVTMYEGLSFKDVFTTTNADQAEDVAEWWVLQGEIKWQN